MKAQNTRQLSAASRLFSATVFREMAKKGRSATFARLVALIGDGLDRQATQTVANVFDRAFSKLDSAGSRDEYIYRAAIIHKVLLGTHSLNTASMLTEFRTGNCKADLVILNGTATAYEIKSERDSLTRLETQVINYRKVFASVNVITSESHVAAVCSAVPSEVGILRISNRRRISTVRSSSSRPEEVCPVSIFESLRAVEAKSVLKMLGSAIPVVPNTKLHAAMREVFAEQDPAAVHRAMVEILKRTRTLAPLVQLVDQLPSSLHAAALSIRIKKCEHDRLVKAVSTPMLDAMSWV
jgi:hypothetical protein